MMGARLKRAANVIGVGLAQSELTNAASVAACHDTDNLCLPARAGVARYGELAGFALADLDGVLSPTRRCHLSHESIMGTRRMFHAGLVGTAVTRPPSTMNSLPVE